MQDYTLYYWSVPFRGQFVRAVLAFAGRSWREAGDGEIGRLMDLPVEEMPIPFMGPPMLVDHANDVAIAQMPAIVLYLGDTLGLLPDDPTLRALTMKIVNDANDVIDEITLQGGQQMWTPEKWSEFVPRLQRWMTFWEVTGHRHGLTSGSGFLLGSDEPGIADVVTATLWSTMGGCFPKIAAMLDKTAPDISALSRRISDLPPLRELAARARADYGGAYCGGQIEASLRRVVGGSP